MVGNFGNTSFEFRWMSRGFAHEILGTLDPVVKTWVVSHTASIEGMKKTVQIHGDLTKLQAETIAMQILPATNC